jgi:hypothetical protein
MSELERWVNPIYVEEFRSGQLTARRELQPFPFAVLKDFLRPEALASVLEVGTRTHVEPSHHKGVAKDADWHWGAFAHLDYVRFFLGKEMRAFMNELMDTNLMVKKKAIPQFNVFKPHSPGIPVHTDFCEEVDVVTILQLSEGYEPGRGGELAFYRREGRKVVLDKWIVPVCNTLILFKVSEESYHSVEDMQGDWTRRTITYDWLTCNESSFLPAPLF